MYKKMDMDLMKLMEEFGTEGQCRDRLTSLRWPDGVKCPRCESDKVRNSYTRFQYDCGTCGYQFSATAGTIFHDSHLPLPKWFAAIYLIVESKKGMSANQMKRTLHISYKTAWYLCHRIRAAMRQAMTPTMKGTVEIDETYIGGKVRGKGKGYVGNKAIVAGIRERGGRIELEVVPSNDKPTLQAFVKANLAPDAKAIYTDEHPSYKGMDMKGAQHESVNHKAEEWVRGVVHTNSIESIWSLVDRSIVGSFHKVSVKHLDAYLDEVEWRQNNKENQYLFRDTLKKLIASDNLPFSQLIGQRGNVQGDLWGQHS